jgi:hypothetical protein
MGTQGTDGNRLDGFDCLGIEDVAELEVPGQFVERPAVV